MIKALLCEQYGALPEFMNLNSQLSLSCANFVSQSVRSLGKQLTPSLRTNEMSSPQEISSYPKAHWKI